MAYFITRSQLERYGSGISIQYESIASLQAKNTAYRSQDAEVTVFLSHSHKDRNLIQPAVAFLRSHGVKIYVDWMDEGMPDVVSGETARKLKERIQQNTKFIVLVTENSKDSRWVPWELGYADPVKGFDNIAAFLVTEGVDFTKNEYFGIYPRIEMIANNWNIWCDDPQKITRLPDWLRQR